MNKKEILTEDIIDKCEKFRKDAEHEVYHRIDMDIKHDLAFAIAERIFWYYVDLSDIYEEPDIDDIYIVVEEKYLGMDE